MIKINQGYWFPLVVRIVGFVLIPIIIMSFTIPVDSLASYFIRIVVLLVCVVGLTSRNFLEFDVDDKSYFEYRWIMGYKFGERTKFDSIEKLFVNKVNLVKNVFEYGTVVVPNSSEVRTSVYKCFIKFGDGEKMLLDSDEDKDKLMGRLKEYNKILKTTLYDTTSHEPRIIE